MRRIAHTLTAFKMSIRREKSVLFDRQNRLNLSKAAKVCECAEHVQLDFSKEKKIFSTENNTRLLLANDGKNSPMQHFDVNIPTAPATIGNCALKYKYN